MLPHYLEKPGRLLITGINSLRGFSLLGAASRWFLQGQGWSLLPIPYPCLSLPPHLHPFFLSLCSMGSIQWEIAIKTFTKLQFSLWLPLRRLNVHKSLFFFFFPNKAQWQSFQECLSYWHRPPTKGINTLKTTPQWIIKPGAKGREVLVLRHGGENEVRSNFFRAQHLCLVALQISSQWFAAFLSSFLSINYLYLWYQERGLVFLLGVIRVIKGFVMLLFYFSVSIQSLFLCKRKI